MLKDFEGNCIYLSQNPNSHLLILGKSGYGKTYFLCRQMEEKISEKKKIFLIDYSGSYTKSELEKNNFRFCNKVDIINPYEMTLQWDYSKPNLSSALIDTLINVLNIRSYYQKKLLNEGILSVLSINNFFSIPLLVSRLELLLSEKYDADERKNICHLLTKIDPYSSLQEIQFLSGMDICENGKYPSMTILQLSNYPEIQRKFLVEFFTEMFWVEARMGKGRADIIALDEFQKLDLSPGMALSSMLREGRKFGLSVYLSSQFVAGYDNEAVSTLMQAANKIFFHPCDNDLRMIANFIDPTSPNTWRSILKKLHKGEAVLSGSFRLGKGRKDIHTPIICEIGKEPKQLLLRRMNYLPNSLFVNNEASTEAY